MEWNIHGVMPLILLPHLHCRFLFRQLCFSIVILMSPMLDYSVLKTFWLQVNQIHSFTGSFIQNSLEAELITESHNIPIGIYTWANHSGCGIWRAFVSGLCCGFVSGMLGFKVFDGFCGMSFGRLNAGERGWVLERQTRRLNIIPHPSVVGVSPVTRNVYRLNSFGYYFVCVYMI
jgi:hypothetical protein